MREISLTPNFSWVNHTTEPAQALRRFLGFNPAPIAAGVGRLQFSLSLPFTPGGEDAKSSARSDMSIATHAARCAKLCRSGTQCVFAWALPEVHERQYPSSRRSYRAWPNYRGGRCYKRGAPSGACPLSGVGDGFNEQPAKAPLRRSLRQPWAVYGSQGRCSPGAATAAPRIAIAPVSIHGSVAPRAPRSGVERFPLASECGPTQPCTRCLAFPCRPAFSGWQRV